MKPVGFLIQNPSNTFSTAPRPFFPSSPRIGDQDATPTRPQRGLLRVRAGATRLTRSSCSKNAMNCKICVKKNLQNLQIFKQICFWEKTRFESRLVLQELHRSIGHLLRFTGVVKHLWRQDHLGNRMDASWCNIEKHDSIQTYLNRCNDITYLSSTSS